MSYPFLRTLLWGSQGTLVLASLVQTPRCLCLADLVVSLGPQAFFSGICAFGLQIFCVFQLSTGESELWSICRLSLRSGGLSCLELVGNVLLAQRFGIVLPCYVSLVLGLETLFGFPCFWLHALWQPWDGSPFSCFLSPFFEWG